MIDDMDINCGDVLDGVTLEAKGQEIFDAILSVASGEKTKSELLGYGDLEYVPWQIGATMCEVDVNDAAPLPVMLGLVPSTHASLRARARRGSSRQARG